MGLFDRAKRSFGYNDHKLKETGIKGTAKVLSDVETHMSVGGDEDGDGATPIHKQTLQITIPDRAPYEVTYHLQGGLPVGKELDVYVDKKDPNKVFVDTGTGLEGVAAQISALTGQTVGNDPQSIMQAAQTMQGQFVAAATPGAMAGTPEMRQMMEQNARMALQLITDPAQRQMVIDQYRAAGIEIDDEGAAPKS